MTLDQHDPSAQAPCTKTIFLAPCEEFVWANPLASTPDERISIIVAIKAVRYICESIICMSSFNQLSLLGQNNLGRAIGPTYRPTPKYRLDTAGPESLKR